MNKNAMVKAWLLRLLARLEEQGVEDASLNEHGFDEVEVKIAFEKPKGVSHE